MLSLRASFPFEYGGLKPILPFLGGRSDAACRIAIRLHAVPVDARVGVNVGQSYAS